MRMDVLKDGDHHSIILLGQKFCRKSHGDWIGWASSCWSNWSDLEAAASLDVYLCGCANQNESWIVNHQLKNYQLTIETDYLVAGLARLQVLSVILFTGKESNLRFAS